MEKNVTVVRCRECGCVHVVGESTCIIIRGTITTGDGKELAGSTETEVSYCLDPECLATFFATVAIPISKKVNKEVFFETMIERLRKQIMRG